MNKEELNEYPVDEEMTSQLLFGPHQHILPPRNTSGPSPSYKGIKKWSFKWNWTLFSRSQKKGQQT